MRGLLVDGVEDLVRVVLEHIAAPTTRAAKATVPMTAKIASIVVPFKGSDGSHYDLCVFRDLYAEDLQNAEHEDTDEY